MSTKVKSLAELANDLEAENKRLLALKKYFNMACKSEFGYDMEGLHNIIIKCKRLEAKVAQQGQQKTNERQ